MSNIEQAMQRFDRLRMMVGTAGFGVAVAIAEKNLPPDFFEGLNYGNWLDIATRAPNGALKDRATNKVIELAGQDFNKWRFVYDQTPYNLCPLLHQEALEQMVETASFDQLVDVYELHLGGLWPEAINNRPLASRALARLQELYAQRTTEEQ